MKLRKISKRIFALLTALIIPFSFISCSNNLNSSSNNKGKYEKITPKQAKEIMENEKDYIILDVRTKDEYVDEHIEGAILIPEYEIASQAEEKLQDKNKLILVYCRSGRRSKIAAEELVKLGYTNVKDFGGIIDWPYDTVM